jgi:hypothetical protein
VLCTLALAAEQPAKPDSVVEMNQVTVSDVPIAEQILPTARPINSVMGDGMSIIDTPRSVTSVNKIWMEERMVKDATDFGQFAPGVYSASQYGVPSIPQIRGDLGEVYIDGQKTKYSRNENLPSFNSVEALDIVKGPGSAVYGPQGMGPGGYVNLVTKKPYFDGFHGEIDTTLGYWTSGHSNFNPEATIDLSGPISKDLAYRVSYQSRYGDAYVQTTKNETQDLFTAITYNASPTVKFDWFGQVYVNRFNASSGFNRVTQNLIDKGIYIGGPAQANNLFGQPITTSTIFTLLNPATAHLQTLQPYQQLIGYGDDGHALRGLTHLATTITLSENSYILNTTSFETSQGHELNTYSYTDYVPVNTSINNRFELHQKANWGGFGQSIIAGVDARYDRLTSYQDFSVEPLANWDLTNSVSTFIYAPYITTGTVGGYAVPGKPGYSAANFPNAGTQHSKILDAALFFQDSINLTHNLTGVVGLRADRIHATAASPALVGLAYGAFYNASATVTDPSLFTSLVYKVSDDSSVYATFDRVNAITGSTNFGGVDGTGGVAGLTNAMKALSKLYEVGFKQSAFHNKLYMAFDVFQQTRMRPVLIGPAQLVRTDGFEAEAVYQPSKKLTINANVTYQDATQYGNFFYEQTNSYLDFYPTSMIVDGKPGTGKGSPNFSGYSPPTGKIRAPGVPGFMANAFVTYRLPSGFGAGFGPQIQGRQNANDEATLVIPAQVEYNGFLFYKTKRWEVQLNVKNIFNKLLYDPVDVTFAGNDTILPRTPITASMTFRRHF